MAAVPAYVKTWTQALTSGTPGIRVSYVSVIDTMQNVSYGWKNFLVTGGCTVVWSASGGTGPTNSSDHTDRITSAATWTPRATTAGASQAWVVLLDGNGGQLLMAFTGASDDVGYLSYSPTAAFVLAGTTNNRPTATDEQVISSGVSLVGSATSADRIWHGLISSDFKSYRFTVLRSSAIVGQSWFVETFTPVTTPGHVAITPVIAGCYATAVLSSFSSFYGGFGASSLGGNVRIVISSVPQVAGCSMQTWWGPANNYAPQTFNFQPEVQGSSLGFIPWPHIMMSNTASTRGIIGTALDFWSSGPSGFLVGDGFGPTYEWWQLGVWLWPNPSNIAPTLA